MTVVSTLITLRFTVHATDSFLTAEIEDTSEYYLR